MKILFAEDNALIRRVAGAMLDKLGHEADFAENGAVAVTKCGETLYDVVLMDMHMPVMEGDEATQRIRALPLPAGRVPVVAVTATDNEAERMKSVSSGMNAFLMKPFTEEMLAETLSAFSGKGEK